MDEGKETSSTPTLEDDLREALKESEGEEEIEETEEVAKSEETEEEPEEEAEELTETDEEEPESETEEGEPEATIPEGLEAPEHWAEEDKKTFYQLSREGQDFLLRREKETTKGFHEKTQALSEKLKVFDGVLKDFQQAKIAPEQGIALLVDNYNRTRS